jgi:hypothetical protein
MKRVFFVIGLATVLAPTSLFAQANAPTQTPGGAPNQAALEKKFSETMSGAVMVGSFTVTGQGKDKDLKQERYTLGEVKKLENGFWLFPVRIQYGEKDSTVPLPLQVQWAGDTPMITLTKFPVPGFGTFTARVLIYDDHYAGYWSGGDHGGHLFGTIERANDQPGAKPEPKAGT